MFHISDLESEKIDNNANYLSNLVANNPDCYDDIIYGNKTLTGKLCNLFPQYTSTSQRLRNLIFPENKVQENIYLSQFAVFLDGLDLATESDDEKFNSICEHYENQYGSIHDVPIKIKETEKENFELLEDIEFLGGDSYVYDLDWNIDKEYLQKQNIFSGSGKHFLGVSAMTTLFNLVPTTSLYDTTSPLIVAAGGISLFALRAALCTYLPSLSSDYLILQEKTKRADIFMEKVFK